jgi:hypothetical protein
MKKIVKKTSAKISKMMCGGKVKKMVKGGKVTKMCGL